MEFFTICNSVLSLCIELNSHSVFPDDTGDLYRGILPMSANGWWHRRIARIPLRYLTSKEWDKEWDTTPDMCEDATRQAKRIDLPAGYPRICYASDHIEHPVLAESSPRLKIQMEHSPEMTQSNSHERKRRTLQNNDSWFREDAIRAAPKRRKRILG
jgi:hypothetical protein